MSLDRRILEEISRKLINFERRILMLEAMEGPGAWQIAVSAFSYLQGLRAFWPMSSVDQSGNVYDYSEQDRTLTNNGSIPFGTDRLVPYADFTPNDYFSRLDEAGLDISAGLTMGGWWYFDTPTTGNIYGLIDKWGGVGNYAYRLYKRDVGNQPVIHISDDGTAIDGVQSSKVAVDAEWHFIVGRFTVSSALDLFVANQSQPNLLSEGIASGMAGLFNSSADLYVGAQTGPANYLDGRATLVFLCEAALPDVVITTLYQSTRGMFGV